MIKKIHMSWEMFDEDINDFLGYIDNQSLGTKPVIIGLKRGGLPTSTTLSNKLDIPISVVSFQTRDNDDIVPNFLEPEMLKDATSIIIPDDIYDTGHTVETIVKSLVNDYNIPLDKIIGLFHYYTDKINDSKLKLRLSVRDNEGCWIVMPWE